MHVKKIIASQAALALSFALFGVRVAHAAENTSGELAEPGPNSDPTQQAPQQQQPQGQVEITPEGPQTSPVPALQRDQAAAEDAKADAEPPKPRPFAGSQVFLQTSMFTGTVLKAQQQYSNPTVDQSVFLQPRYALNKDWQLRGRVVFTYEYTNADNTTTKHEPRFSDTSVQLMYRGIPAFKGIKPLVGVSLAVPTSPESRARTMLVNPGLSVQLAKTFEHVLGGEVTLLGGLSYSHPLYRFTTPGTRDQTPYAFQCYGATSSCDGQLTGTANASDSISWTALVSGDWGKWSPALFFLGAHQWAYTFSDLPGVTRLEDHTSVRQTTYFSAWLDYNFNSWFTAEGGYFMQRNVLSDDGKYGNPFFDRYQDTRVYVGFNFNVDSFVEKVVQKKQDSEGGVVRAKNNRGPALGAF